MSAKEPSNTDWKRHKAPRKRQQLAPALGHKLAGGLVAALAGDQLGVHAHHVLVAALDAAVHAASQLGVARGSTCSSQLLFSSLMDS